MGTLGKVAAFFLGGAGLGLGISGVGGGLAGDGSGLGVTGTGEVLALDLAMAGEVILACSNACARSTDDR